jgi:hypothetical protein
MNGASDKRAMPIEDFLEWVYRVQRADLVLSRADHREKNWLAGAGISGDGCAVLERQGVLGTRIDGGGYAAADLHPDAEATHITIGLMLRSGALSHAQVGLLLECGKTGGVPVWELEEAPEPTWVEASVPGGVEVRGGKLNQFCPLSWEPPLHLVEGLQDIYTQWFDGLMRVWSALSVTGGLIDHRPALPAVLARPWQ